MTNTDDLTGARPLEERRKDLIKLLRRAQLFMIPVCVASTVICTQSLGAYVELPKLPLEGWIALDCLMIATIVGPIEIMITEAKIQWGRTVCTETTGTPASNLPERLRRDNWNAISRSIRRWETAKIRNNRQRSLLPRVYRSLRFPFRTHDRITN